ncbi:hypothetical protein [Campylobacter coli]|uniref:hypothetical protein n=1 Tax=Campylobacter coli TaxID=195 RepID=UPI003B51D9E5
MPEPSAGLSLLAGLGLLALLRLSLAGAARPGACGDPGSWPSAAVLNRPSCAASRSGTAPGC